MRIGDMLSKKQREELLSAPAKEETKEEWEEEEKEAPRFAEGNQARRLKYGRKRKGK